MAMDLLKRKALTSWSSLGLLAVLCIVLAAIQYRWLGELAEAEKDRLRDGLQISLARVSSDFNARLAETFAALVPSEVEIEENGREAAYANRFLLWADGNAEKGIVSRFGLVIPRKDRLELRLFNPGTGEFYNAEWPAAWDANKKELGMRASGAPVRPLPGGDNLVVSMPRFGPRLEGFPPMGEREWIVLEYDRAYLTGRLLPALIERSGLNSGAVRWEVVVSSRHGAREVLFPPGATRPASAEVEARTSIFETPRPRIGRAAAESRVGDLPVADAGRGDWLMEARSAGPALETAVRKLRWRNLAISAAILSLMLFTAVLLVRSTRQEQRLAEMQMNFVTSVSHELRTPLTVIRTAAFNLRGRVARNPEQVERYGGLIQEESKKLGEMVENILRYASAGAGKLIRHRERVAVENIIEESMRSSILAAEGENLTVEKQVPLDLPFVMADESALTHAIRNLIDNAVKYGTANSNWIGISASLVDAASIEIRIADRGPGVPASEKDGIFDPFFRGSHALVNQIHGTGLGLNLVKKIVEAHGGTIRVESEPGVRTEFVVRIPIAPAEQQDEFAHSTS